jgi:TolA-binding protein
VTERGVPEIESESVALIPVPEKQEELDSRSESAANAPLPAAAAELEQAEELAGRQKSRAAKEDDVSAFEAAMAQYQQHHYAEAEHRFEAIAAAGGPDAARAQQMAARAARDRGGCPAAIEKFEQLSARYPGSEIGYDAAWQSAECYRSLGDTERAKRVLRPLVEVPAYQARAEAALNELEGGQAVAARKAASKPVAAETAPAETKPAAPPPAKSNAPGSDTK